MTPDVALTRAAIADAPRALDQLVDAWLPTVLGWCIRMGGPKVNAEDAAQDVFEVVFDRLPTLRDPDAFPAWLYGITRKTLAKHRRRAWLRYRVLGMPLEEQPDWRSDPSRQAQREQTGRRVWQALDQLPEHHREVLVLCDLEERADSDAADLLGVPKGTVKSRLRRARIALRGLLTDLPMPEDS